MTESRRRARWPCGSMDISRCLHAASVTRHQAQLQCWFIPCVVCCHLNTKLHAGCNIQAGMVQAHNMSWSVQFWHTGRIVCSLVQNMHGFGLTCAQCPRHRAGRTPIFAVCDWHARLLHKYACVGVLVSLHAPLPPELLRHWVVQGDIYNLSLLILLLHLLLGLQQERYTLCVA